MSSPRLVFSRAIVALALAALLLPAVGTPVRADSLNLELVGNVGDFDAPIYLTHAGDARLFVVEQRGLIRIVGGGTFLDLSDRVSQSGSERGLLGLAFPPDYSASGLFYVYYTRDSDGDIVISEFQRSAGDPDAADPNSERIVLTIEHSMASNHNGGWLAFKADNLFIATGDGGSTPNNAPSKTSLLGKILRIDPQDPDGNGPLTYSIPSTNPYVGQAGRDEIWARGLRNPWRCSFDRLSRKLWCGDVGQNAFEEINRSRTGKGLNYGWPVLEGDRIRSTGSPCTSNCRTLPTAVYSHATNNGPCAAVTGGYVARRSGAALYGKYVFGDYCSGKVWIIPANFPAGAALPAPVVDTNYWISSFGEGSDGRLYLLDRAGGSVYRLSDS